MGMAYIDCPELSSVFGCDVVVHATQAHLETSGCSQYTLQHSNQTWLADAGKSKKNVRKMVVELGLYCY